MSCQRRILGIRWQDMISNVKVAAQTHQANINTLIQMRRHALFGHVVRMNKRSPAYTAATLYRDISEERRVPSGWKRPPGRPRSTWMGQIKADHHNRPTSTLWRLAGDRVKWKVDAKALNGYAVQ